MSARFDDATRRIELSVADLIDRDAARRIGFSQRGGFERLWIGQAIHSTYQERALLTDPTYRREVAVTAELVVSDWTIRVQGRIDGIRRADDGAWILEEIKSVRSGSTLSPQQSDLYRQQALTYEWMLRQKGATPELLEDGSDVRTELVYITIGTQEVEREGLVYDDRVLTARALKRIRDLIRGHERQRARSRRRRHAAERLQFPFFSPRPGQDEIIDRVARAVEDREHLLVEAPTGIGKTAACLFPALQQALGNDLRIFVLTAKNTQQAMAVQVLDLMNQDRSYNSLQLRAKARMCANDELICHEDYCRFARDYSTKLSRSDLLNKLLTDGSQLLPDDIYAAAKTETVCPFEVSLELSRSCQAIVCDYNYAFEPYVALTDFHPEESLENVVLVVDEIHNLVDRSRGYYSPRLDAKPCRDAAVHYRVSPTTPVPGAEILERLEALLEELAEIIEHAVDDAVPRGSERMTTVHASVPVDALWTVRPEFDAAFIDYLEHRRETQSFRSEDPFVEIYFGLLRFLNTAQLATDPAHRERFDELLERDGDRSSLRLLCKDASPFIGAIVNRCRSCIGLSATLTPPEFYSDLLGFDPDRTSHVSIGNAFPQENRVVVVDSSVTTTYRKRPTNYEPIAQRLGEFAAQVPGNCLALFPSYQFLAEVHGLLPEIPRRVLVQQRTDGEQQRTQILETLRNALFGDVLLLAVAGGVFAEGVDYPGDMLSAVAVVGPCLPALSVEQKALEVYLNERYGRGFEYAFVVPGMTRVIQAAGRLIRSADDRGVIALFDERFLRSPYVEHLPEDWVPEGEARALAGHPATVAAAFFRERTQS